MKKINLLLILCIIICSFFVIMSELNRGIVVILKDSSIVLTLLFPYLLRRLFKIKISEWLILIWIIFIFISHFLGVVCSLYNEWYYLDKISHTFSGILSGAVGVLIIKNVGCKNMLFNILFILSFTWMCAGLWEVFEFTCNALFGGDAQRVMLTGVNDTMWDLIVAFLGSICVSFVYYFKES